MVDQSTDQNDGTNELLVDSIEQRITRKKKLSKRLRKRLHKPIASSRDGICKKKKQQRSAYFLHTQKTKLNEGVASNQ